MARKVYGSSKAEAVFTDVKESNLFVEEGENGELVFGVEKLTSIVHRNEKGTMFPVRTGGYIEAPVDVAALGLPEGSKVMVQINGYIMLPKEPKADKPSVFRRRQRA